MSSFAKRWNPKLAFGIGVLLLCGALLFAVGTLSPYGLAPSFRLFRGGDLNRHVMAVVKRYPTDGTHRQMPESLINTSYGTTQDIHYMGRRVARGDSERRAYCVGLMFEVYMKACENAAGRSFRLDRVSATNFEMFRRDWYGVGGQKRTFVEALTSRGLGKEITTTPATNHAAYLMSLAMK
jgi:hypothetical protein